MSKSKPLCYLLGIFGICLYIEFKATVLVILLYIGWFGIIGIFNYFVVPIGVQDVLNALDHQTWKTADTVFDELYAVSRLEYSLLPRTIEHPCELLEMLAMTQRVERRKRSSTSRKKKTKTVWEYRLTPHGLRRRYKRRLEEIEDAEDVEVVQPTNI